MFKLVLAATILALTAGVECLPENEQDENCQVEEDNFKEFSDNAKDLKKMGKILGLLPLLLPFFKFPTPAPAPLPSPVPATTTRPSGPIQDCSFLPKTQHCASDGRKVCTTDANCTDTGFKCCYGTDSLNKCCINATNPCVEYEAGRSFCNKSLADSPAKWCQTDYHCGPSNKCCKDTIGNTCCKDNPSVCKALTACTGKPSVCTRNADCGEGNKCCGLDSGEKCCTSTADSDLCQRYGEVYCPDPNAVIAPVPADTTCTAGCSGDTPLCCRSNHPVSGRSCCMGQRKACQYITQGQVLQDNVKATCTGRTPCANEGTNYPCLDSEICCKSTSQDVCCFPKPYYDSVDSEMSYNHKHHHHHYLNAKQLLVKDLNSSIINGNRLLT